MRQTRSRLDKYLLELVPQGSNAIIRREMSTKRPVPLLGIAVEPYVLHEKMLECA